MTNKTYTCCICGRNIGDEGLFVKLQKPYGNVLCIVPVHKGRCDEELEARCISEEINTNSSMEISFIILMEHSRILSNISDGEPFRTKPYCCSDYFGLKT